MPLTPLDFSNCNQRKCLTAGGTVIFDCNNPCQNGAAFDYATGTCDDPNNCPISVTVKWKATVETFTGSCNPDTEYCFAFGNTQYEQLITNVASNSTVSVETRGTGIVGTCSGCLLYTSPSPRDRTRSRMPSSA